MDTPIKALLEIGKIAADLLERFVSIQNNIRSWKIVLLVPVSYEQHARDVRSIRFCFEQLLDQVESIIPLLHLGSVEADLASSLGHYLCALNNAVIEYENVTRLISYHSKHNKLRGIPRIFKAKRKYAKAVDTYMKEGVVLTNAWMKAKHCTD